MGHHRYQMTYQTTLQMSRLCDGGAASASCGAIWGCVCRKCGYSYSHDPFSTIKVRVHEASIGSCVTTCKRVRQRLGGEYAQHIVCIGPAIFLQSVNDANPRWGYTLTNVSGWTCSPSLNGTPPSLLTFVPSQLLHRRRSCSATEIVVAGRGFVQMAGR